VPGSTGQLDVDWSDDRVQFTVTNTQPDAAREQEAAWAQVTAWSVCATRGSRRRLAEPHTYRPGWLSRDRNTAGAQHHHDGLSQVQRRRARS
jgi:hypothetical protein